MYAPIEPPELKRLLQIDGYLDNYRGEIVRRYDIFKHLLSRIEMSEGLDKFSRAYEEYGIILRDDNSIRCYEWVPGAQQVFLRGDFNNWKNADEEFSYRRCDFGKWELIIPARADGSSRIPLDSIVKLQIRIHNGDLVDRLSPFANYVTQNEQTKIFEQRFWHAGRSDAYKPKHPHVLRKRTLRIYEAHVGIASDEPVISTYENFRVNVLPRILHLGYNAVQLMAIQEHAYYASFGYQVTSFYAPSSRYGHPNELKKLIDECHAHGLVVLLDVVHSHASANSVDGLNQFDGTNSCHFHDGGRGKHDLWGSRLFDYTNWEVLRFLLSNLRYWIEMYKFDGFRYDGVTSMLYHSHGCGHGFSGHYDEYFKLNTDTDSVVYLMLANYACRKLYGDFYYSLAEEVSGMPALCRPVDEGGLGFDYRMQMAVPDLWIKLLRDKSDEQWDMEIIWWQLVNRRYAENHIAYAECHDQALVGDKTIAFWLMDASMYWHMSKDSDPNLIIDRGIALHKVIRLMTSTLGGEGYLTFIGNEFGHPEWLDFPREGNNNSLHYARRQFHLVDDPALKYHFLNEFDAAMNKCEEDWKWLSASPAYVSRKHNEEKTIVGDRGGVVFAFNLHKDWSQPNFRIGVPCEGTYRLVLDSDAKELGGHGRIDHSITYKSQPGDYDSRPHSISIYLPNRTGVVLTWL
jgi:1,4-alpha-glucan branching enzyme